MLYRAAKNGVLFCELLLLLFLINTCSKNTSEPPPPAGPDTTSHSFTWTLDTLGTFGSVLFDVAIVNENDIWAVGEIHTAETDTFDSLGNWVPPYNAVHWNGSEWELQRILVNFRGQPTWAPLRGVFALKDGNIIFSSGLPYLPEANGWKLYHLWDMGVLDDEDGSVYRVWGTSLSNLYFAGSKGTIVHYDGSSWQKLDSGTEVALLDIYGSPDGSVVWACGYTSNFSKSVLLRAENNNWQTLWEWDVQSGSSNPHYEGLMQTLWAVSQDTMLIVSGEGVYRQAMDGSLPPRKEPFFLNAFPGNVRGGKMNDLFLVGFEGMVWHYNGSTWQNYSQFENSAWVLNAVALAGNHTVIVGTDRSQVLKRDIILTGRRP